MESEGFLSCDVLKNQSEIDLAIRHTGDETKEVTKHEAGGGAVNDGKLVNETMESITDGDANGGAFVAEIGDGKQPDETKEIEHADGGCGAPDHVNDGKLEINEKRESITYGDANGGAFVAEIGDGKQPDETKEIEHADGGCGAPDHVNDGKLEINKTKESITDGDANGGAFVAEIGDGKQPDETKEIEHTNNPIDEGGSRGNALDTIDDDGKQMKVVDGTAYNVGDGDLITIRTDQGAAQNEGKQATFLAPDGNEIDTAVAPGGGTPPPIDENIQNKQTHTYCKKRKSQVPGEFSQDGDSGHDAARPKKTKHGDAGRNEIGTGSSGITQPVAENGSFRLFGVNITPCNQEENPVMRQRMRTLRLFGTNISVPKDQK